MKWHQVRLHRQLNLGYMYANGQGVQQDFRAANGTRKLPIRNASAQFNLGGCITMAKEGKDSGSGMVPESC